ncbi:hypothetical protein V9L05_18840 [Bernardetia sp. Wsw4-3y2]|uniref:hypothetical protein n=1 Tax=Bernardetia sp. Wsw4-3y2 TaxID=3127471 RepID=UPI0030D2BDD5
MKKSFFIVLFISLFIFSCNDSSNKKEYKSDNMFELYLRDADSLSKEGLFIEAQMKLESIVDVFPEKKDTLNSLASYYSDLYIKQRDSLDNQKEIAKKEADKLLSNLRVSKDDMKDLSFYESKLTPKYIDVNNLYCYIVEHKTGEPTLRLKIQYAADDWLFVKSYLIKIDEQKFNFIPNEVKRDNSGGKIWEWSDDLIKEDKIEIIKAISEAKSVKIRYIGSDYYHDRNLSSKEIKAVKEILTVYNLLTIAQ